MDEAKNSASSRKKKSQKKQIACLVGILLSIMLLLSLFSYSPEDQATGDLPIGELWRVFTSDEAIQARAQQTQNLLGLLGAIISNWLINSTIGYSILVLPFLGLLWSVILLRQRDVQKLVILSSYFVALALLVSGIFGMFRLGLGMESISTEWSGVVGDFVASVMQKLIGVTGSLIALCGSFVLVLILLIDLDIQKTIDRFREWMSVLGEWMSDSWAAIRERWMAWRHEKKRAQAKRIEIKESGEEAPRPMPSPIPKTPVAKETTVTPGGRRKLVFIEDGIAGRDESSEDQDVVFSTPSVPLSIKKGIRETETEGEEIIADVSEDEEIDYVPPSLDLLEHSSVSEQIDKAELEANAELLRSKLADFDVEIESVSVTPGPVVTLYELVPASGVKISRIESLEDDIALALQSPERGPLVSKSRITIRLSFASGA